MKLNVWSCNEAIPMSFNPNSITEITIARDLTVQNGCLIGADVSVLVINELVVF